MDEGAENRDTLAEAMCIRGFRIQIFSVSFPSYDNNELKELAMFQFKLKFVDKMKIIVLVIKRSLC